jgi:bacterioferritin-associated ferredoxin
MSFACSCKAVRDQTVVAAIIAGARSVEEITAACKAGADCETCKPVLEELLDVARNTGLIKSDEPLKTESNSGGSNPA